MRALCRRMFVGLPVLIRYWLALPTLVVHLTDTPAGRNIAEHLAVRDGTGRIKYRRAQGVLLLPERFEDYMRGRHRQAVRTNVMHAKTAGMEVHHEFIDDWVPGSSDSRRGQLTPTRVERWYVLDADGQLAAVSILAVDRDVGLLQGLVSGRAFARWFLHTAIVERLCGECRVLLTNSEDVPRLDPGNRHFQRLLGYSIFKLRTPRTVRGFISDTNVRLAALSLAVAGLIVAVDAAPRVTPAVGESALIWLTALVALRRASNRAAVAALTALAGAALLALLDLSEDLMVPVAYVVAGVLVDLLLAVFPRLTRSGRAVTVVGVAAMLATLLAPGFPTLGQHGPHVPWPVPPLLAAIGFGALAAALGWSFGGWLLRYTTRAPNAL